MSPLRTCPVCGSKKIERLFKTLNFATPHGPLRVNDVAVDHCNRCGQEFVDSDASQKIDAAAFPTRRITRRRKTA